MEVFCGEREGASELCISGAAGPWRGVARTGPVGRGRAACSHPSFREVSTVLDTDHGR